MICTLEIEEEVMKYISENKINCLGDIECLCKTFSDEFPKEVRSFKTDNINFTLYCSDLVYELITKLITSTKIKVEVISDPIKIFMITGSCRNDSRFQENSYFLDEKNKINLAGLIPNFIKA